MWFFNSFVKSLYDLNWLRARRTETGRAFSYFFLLVFFVSGLSLAPMIVNVARGDTVREVMTVMNEKVPEFTATVKDGKLLITDLVQPYIVRDKDFVIVVDTVASDTLHLENFLVDGAKSGVLISKEKVEMLDARNGQARSQSFSEMGNWSINRTQVSQKLDKFLSKPMLALYVLVIFILAYIVRTVATLVLVLIVSALVLMAVKTAKRSWRFKEIFSVGLFAVTLAVFISTALTGMQVGLPFVSFIVFFTWLSATVFMEKPITKEEIKLQ